MLLNVGKGLADRHAVPIMTAQMRGRYLKHTRPTLFRLVLILALAAVTSAPALAQGIKRLGVKRRQVYGKYDDRQTEPIII